MAGPATPIDGEPWTSDEVDEATQQIIDHNAALAQRVGNRTLTQLEDDLSGAFAPLDVQPRIVRKASSTSRNTTTTMADDPDLTLAVAANTTYILQAILLVEGGQTGDFKFAIAGPAGCSFDGVAVSPRESLTITRGEGHWSGLQINTVKPVAAIGTGITNRVGVKVDGILAVGATAGNVRVQWAQNVSDAADSTLVAGSSLWLQIPQ